MDSHANLRTWAFAFTQTAVSHQLSERKSGLHGTLRHLFNGLWNAKYSDEWRCRLLNNQSSELLDLFAYGLLGSVSV
jgi:hypothetical protein